MYLWTTTLPPDLDEKSTLFWHFVGPLLWRVLRYYFFKIHDYRVFLEKPVNRSILGQIASLWTTQRGFCAQLPSGRLAEH